MAADILNALGYSGVEPMAPGGGADTGRDIRFLEGETPGIAFVTLDKRIREKFRRDLAKQPDAESVIALFCDVDVSPSLKLELAREAIAKGYRLEVFDLERLRSLLDSNLKDVRRRYLKIDDEIATRLRSDVQKLLRFPSAIPDTSTPPTLIETLLVQQVPRRLFDLLMSYEEGDIAELPGLGSALHDHLTAYYQFRQKALQLEEALTLRIGGMVGVRFAVAWRIYLRYALLRFAGAPQEKIISWGSFLNYGITWEGAERVFADLAADAAVSSEVEELFRLHEQLSQRVSSLERH
jgi:hypothetical protein